MWDLPGLGIKPVSSALAGRFFTTEPPGKPLPGASNKNVCQQLAHKESLSFSHINILGYLMKGLFFQISKFCSWLMFPKPYGCWWSEPKFLTTQKVASCIWDSGLKGKVCPWPEQLRSFLYPRKNCFWCSLLVQLLVSTFPWFWGPLCGIITMWVNISEVTQTSRSSGMLNKSVGQLHLQILLAQRLDPTYIFKLKIDTCWAMRKKRPRKMIWKKARFTTCLEGRATLLHSGVRSAGFSKQKLRELI